ncbi:MAG: hypothetical protein AAB393_19220 [Bacteroidota bacterium]
MPKTRTVKSGRSLKKPFALIALILCHFCFIGRATAQVYGSDFHTVTVTVATITAVQVSSPSVSLTITGAGAVAGQDALGTVVDQTSNLLWGVNSANRKITVNSNLAAPQFTLKVVALSPTVGTAMPEVTLSTTASDFLLNIGRSTGSCTLRYTGAALASQGTGTDSHTITFTVTN